MLNGNFFLMGTMKFPDRMIKYIRGYVSTSYSINIDGELNGFLQGAKGHRQGDPLSYFFVIVMEVLAVRLRSSSMKNKGEKLLTKLYCKPKTVSHMI